MGSVSRVVVRWAVDFAEDIRERRWELLAACWAVSQAGGCRSQRVRDKAECKRRLTSLADASGESERRRRRGVFLRYGVVFVGSGQREEQWVL